jgi:hypothetical protein
MRQGEHAQRRLTVETMLAAAALQWKQACELGRPAMRLTHGCHDLGIQGSFAVFTCRWQNKQAKR